MWPAFLSIRSKRHYPFLGNASLNHPNRSSFCCEIGAPVYQTLNASALGPHFDMWFPFLADPSVATPSQLMFNPILRFPTRLATTNPALTSSSLPYPSQLLVSRKPSNPLPAHRFHASRPSKQIYHLLLQQLNTGTWFLITINHPVYLETGTMVVVQLQFFVACTDRTIAMNANQACCRLALAEKRALRRNKLD